MSPSMFPRWLALLGAMLMTGCGGPELWLVVTRPSDSVGLTVTACEADGTRCGELVAEAFPLGDSALTRTVGLELERDDQDSFSLELQSSRVNPRCDRLVVPVEPLGRDITVRLDNANPPGPPVVDCGGARCTLAACLPR